MAVSAALARLRAHLQGVISVLWREILKFGIVGAVAFVVDVGLMNVLRHTVMEDKPTTAKIVSASVATVVAWIGNRQWTFRHRRGRGATSEFSLFVLTNGVALLIARITSSACLPSPMAWRWPLGPGQSRSRTTRSV